MTGSSGDGRAEGAIAAVLLSTDLQQAMSIARTRHVNSEREMSTDPCERLRGRAMDDAEGWALAVIVRGDGAYGDIAAAAQPLGGLLATCPMRLSRLEYELPGRLRVER
jgi:hypothetical protein